MGKVAFSKAKGSKVQDWETCRDILLDGEVVGAVVCVYSKTHARHWYSDRSLRCVKVLGRIWGVELPHMQTVKVVVCRNHGSPGGVKIRIHPNVAVAQVKNWARTTIATALSEEG